MTVNNEPVGTSSVLEEVPEQVVEEDQIVMQHVDMSSGLDTMVEGQVIMMTNANGDVLDEFYEMPNGCIWCTVKDDLVSTLELLVENKPEGP